MAGSTVLPTVLAKVTFDDIAMEGESSAAEVLRSNGYLVRQQVLATKDLDYLRSLARSLMAARLEAQPIVTTGLMHVDQFRFASLHLAHKRIRELAFSDSVFEIVADVLGEDAGLVQAAFLCKTAGCVGHHPHQDSSYVRSERGCSLTVWIALDEAGPENGGLVVLPGSHARGIHPTSALKMPMNAFSTNSVELSIPSGGAVFWHGDLVHLSKDQPVTCNRPRYSLVLNFVSANSGRIASHLTPALNCFGDVIVSIQPW
jgi:phytanoyl-CoA hydroxylase